MIAAACTGAGAPLLQLELRELLQPRPGVHTRPEADRFLRKVAALLETRDNLTNKRVRWLVDPRAGGRRLRAWIDVMQERQAPWDGFPHQPRFDEQAR